MAQIRRNRSRRLEPFEAETFGVHPSYVFDRGRKLLIINQEAMEILWDEALSAIARKSLHLPLRDRQMILNIIRQFEGMQETDEGRGP